MAVQIISHYWNEDELIDLKKVKAEYVMLLPSPFTLLPSSSFSSGASVKSKLAAGPRALSWSPATSMDSVAHLASYEKVRSGAVRSEIHDLLLRAMKVSIEKLTEDLNGKQPLLPLDKQAVIALYNDRIQNYNDTPADWFRRALELTF